MCFGRMYHLHHQGGDAFLLNVSNCIQETLSSITVCETKISKTVCCLNLLS
jgi:hypothetical protein